MERNYSIDLLKFTMAVLVVFLHSDWLGTDYVNPIARCAVPTFFMISGFLLYDGHTIGNERIVRNLKNIWHIFVWSSILFLVLNISRHSLAKLLTIDSDSMMCVYYIINSSICVIVCITTYFLLKRIKANRLLSVMTGGRV